jgi:hypothetical protein
MNEQWAQLDPDIKLQYEKRADYLRRSEARKVTTTKRDDAVDSGGTPITGYSIFVRERHNSLKLAQPELSLSQRSAEISAEWTTMAATDRRTFINIAKRETRKFRHISDDEESGEPRQSRDLT